MPPSLLLAHRLRARHQLLNTPGPHQMEREEYEENSPWLSWWLALLAWYIRHPEHQPKEKRVFATPDQIRIEIALHQPTSGFHTGLFMMGGGEGTAAHRNIVAQALQIAPILVLLFEEEAYVQAKPRGGRFLPLALVVSLWNYFPGELYIGIAPPPEPGADLNEHYLWIDRRIDADV